MENELARGADVGHQVLMKVFRTWRDLPISARGAVVALGNFDGIHLGHVSLLRAAHSARPDLPLAVVTFEPHPREYFRPDDPPFRLTLANEKVGVLSDYGVNLVYELPFNESLSNLSADHFLENVLLEGLGVRHICCGPDFAFGHRRGGDVDRLTKWSEAHGIGLTVVPALSDAKGQISSSRIRRLLQDGYPEEARAELGRPWSISGTVCHGEKRGRLLGFPTANLVLGQHLEPARGVYAVTVRMENQAEVEFQGVANIGVRPTIGSAVSRLEAHIFDFNQDIYCENIAVSLHKFIRLEHKFSSLDDLKLQIRADADFACQFFSISKKF